MRVISATFLLIIAMYLSPVSVLAAGGITSDALTDAGNVAFDVADGAPEDIGVTIGRLISVLLSFLGVIFLLIVVYSGFLWMTAGGNDAQIGKAKKLIVNGVVGLIIIFFAYGITQFVLTSVTGEERAGAPAGYIPTPHDMHLVA